MPMRLAKSTKMAQPYFIRLTCPQHAIVKHIFAIRLSFLRNPHGLLASLKIGHSYLKVHSGNIKNPSSLNDKKRRSVCGKTNCFLYVRGYMTSYNVAEHLERAKVELDQLRRSCSSITEPSGYNDKKNLEELRAYSQRLRGVSSNLRRVSTALREFDKETAYRAVSA